MSDDKDIRDLFNNFKPELTSSQDFLDKLEENLNAAEIIRSYYKRRIKRNRFAMAWAACAGFATGVGCMYLLPLISPAFESIFRKFTTEYVDASSQILSYFIFTLAMATAVYATYTGLRKNNT